MPELPPPAAGGYPSAAPGCAGVPAASNAGLPPRGLATEAGGATATAAAEVPPPSGTGSTDCCASAAAKGEAAGRDLPLLCGVPATVPPLPTLPAALASDAMLAWGAGKTCCPSASPAAIVEDDAPAGLESRGASRSACGLIVRAVVNVNGAIPAGAWKASAPRPAAPLRAASELPLLPPLGRRCVLPAAAAPPQLSSTASAAAAAPAASKALVGPGPGPAAPPFGPVACWSRAGVVSCQAAAWGAPKGLTRWWVRCCGLAAGEGGLGCCCPAARTAVAAGPRRAAGPSTCGSGPPSSAGPGASTPQAAEKQDGHRRMAHLARRVGVSHSRVPALHACACMGCQARAHSSAP